MRKILLIAVLAITAVACNKNQKAVKTLDGSWNATSYLDTWDGETTEYIVPGTSVKMAFDNCKLKDDEFCRVTFTFTEGTDTDVEILDYRVGGYGTSLLLRDPEYPIDLTYMEIVEFTKDQLELKADYGDGDIIQFKFEKE